MPSDVLQLAGKALAALDTQSLVSLYADEFLFEDTSSGARLTTKEELRAYFDTLFSLPNVSFSEVSFFRMRNMGAGRWTWGGTSRQSGAEFTVSGASLFKLDEDTIVEEAVFYDPRPAYS